MLVLNKNNVSRKTGRSIWKNSWRFGKESCVGILVTSFFIPTFCFSRPFLDYIFRSIDQSLEVESVSQLVKISWRMRAKFIPLKTRKQCGEWQVNDRRMISEWQVNDRWMIGEWQVNDRWMTGEWQANDRSSGLISSHLVIRALLLTIIQNTTKSSSHRAVPTVAVLRVTGVGWRCRVTVWHMYSGLVARRSAFPVSLPIRSRTSTAWTRRGVPL